MNYKILCLGFILMSVPFAFADNENASGSSNPVSKGKSSTMSGVSDSKEGPTGEEKQEVRERSKSMSGAPNMGGGMGTGTGPVREKQDNKKY